MKRLLIVLALLSAPGCSTLSSLPLFSGMGPSADDPRSSPGAMAGAGGPASSGSKAKSGLTW